MAEWFTYSEALKIDWLDELRSSPFSIRVKNIPDTWIAYDKWGKTFNTAAVVDAKRNSAYKNNNKESDMTPYSTWDRLNAKLKLS